MKRQNPTSQEARAKADCSQAESEREQYGLSYQEFVFCQSYLTHFNQTEAALKAGKSSASAYQRGYEMRRRPRVRAYLDAKMAEHHLSREETLAIMTDKVQASLEDVLTFSDDGKVSFDPKRAIESGAIRHLKRFWVGENGSYSVELIDTNSILRQLAKLHGLIGRPKGR